MLKRVFYSLGNLTAMVIVLGLLKTTLYYKAFNLPSKYFLSLSELGVIIFEDLILVFCFFGFIVLIMDGIIKHCDISVHTNLERYRNTKNPKWYNILISAIFLGSIVSFFFQRDYSLKLMVLMAIIVSGQAAFYSVFRKAIISYTPNPTSLALVGMSVLLPFYMIYSANAEIISVKNNKYKGTIIRFSDNIFDTSTSTKYFIGKTTDFVFLYNSKDSVCSIIPLSEIKRIDIKSK